MKKDKLYTKLLERRVVTIDEIVEAARDLISNPTTKYVLSKYVAKFIKEGKLVRIRRGLYACLGPLDDPTTYVPDKFLVGAKTRSGGFLGYHTALEFHGYAHSTIYNRVYICVGPSRMFKEFSHAGLRFKPVSVQDAETGVVKEKYLDQPVRVTDRERTFVDCVERVNYAGGWEECLKSLETARGLNFDRVVDYTLARSNKFLARKVGFVLDLLRETSSFYEHLEEKHLRRLSKRAGRSPMYLDKTRTFEERPILNEKWRLYLSPHFKERFLRGV